VKLMPPSLGPSYVARPRLEQLLSEVMQRRLTVMVAGPGFGKSTLLASWAADGNAAWYSLGGEDAQLPTLARGIVDAVRLRAPGIPLELSSALSSVGAVATDGEEEIGRAQAFAQFLAQALEENLTRPLLLVLDDVDEGGLSPVTGQLIGSLCRQAPPNVHFVLSSRTSPPFRVDRLRGQGQMLELGGADLSFTADEVATLVRHLVPDAEATIASSLYDLTGGWPAVVRLAIEALRPVPVDERNVVLERLRQPGGALYRYLAGEVLATEPDEVRRLIAVVARTGFAAPRLCEELGTKGAAEILASLAQRGLFVQGRGQRLGWFSISTLVRETALAELAMSAAEARQVDARTWAWLEAQGHPAEALRYCCDYFLWEPAAQLLERYGAQLVSGGGASEVLSALDGLPVEMRSPGLEFVAGEAYYVVGDWDNALSCYGRACLDPALLPTALAWRVARIHHFRGDLNQALEAYGDGAPVEGDLADRAMLLAWRASARWLRGDAEGCRQDASQALEMARVAGDAGALSCAHTAMAMLAALDGDRAANDAHYLRALDYALQSGDLLQQVRVRTNRGSLFLEQGYYEEAIAELDLALRLADLAGFASYRSLALSNRGCAYYYLGRMEEAIDDLEESRRQSERLGSADVAYALGNMGRIYLDRGDLALARAAYEEAIARSEESQDVQGLVPALSGLAVTLATDDPAAAQALAARAVGYGPGMAHGEALLASGWVAMASGQHDEAARRAIEAGAEARSRRDRAGLAQSLELGAVADAGSPAAAKALEQATSLWSELRSVTGEARTELLAALVANDPERTAAAKARLQQLGVRSHRSLGTLFNPAGPGSRSPIADQAPVAVKTLGRFGVLVDGRSVAAAAWQSRKARDLLKILVTRRGRPTPRDELMDLLWPEEPGLKVGNRLSVAVSTLRTVLDPSKGFPANHFIISDRVTLRLDYDHIDVDIEAFLRDVAAGLSRARRGDEGAVDLLERAETAYIGDFLQENAYDDWAAGLREEARTAYLQACRALAAAAHSRGDRGAAATYLRRLLERDQYDEPAHLELVRLLVADGHHGEAHRCYRVYGTRMREMDVEATPFPA
jgi:ATP/maltotriose-dependent transcriptional regulator MalT/DNA-binding SARP family transcriptional activator